MAQLRTVANRALVFAKPGVRLSPDDPPSPARKAQIMEFGASIFFTDYSISPAELAVALEERGFDFVWAAEHSHIPVPRRTPAARRRRIAEALLRCDGSVRHSDRSGGRDQAT